eukprot:TRINITY_DN17216_c0_g1_i1.p1 TRINITY_DN17216_c0_g1~~TRINITY_DN17216_c0_g1_i1.p1  ORF type:complete len:564 (-),score=120.56 TRINITY_DN17216_c0_g1_i1:73-1764(-)
MEGKEEEEEEGGTTRVFVGGLGLTVTSSDLHNIFSSLGTVKGVEIVRSTGRSFAYIDFHPSSHKALPKLFSKYNGCVWKGGRLRLEKAKEHYLVRLKREWADDVEPRRVTPNVLDVDINKYSSEKSKHLNPEKMQLQIFFPRLKKVKSLPYSGTGKHKYSFQHVEVPSLPIHFCDCEEHCGPLETANQKHVSAINEEELKIMSSVLNKLFEREANMKALNGPITSAVEDGVPSDKKEEAQAEDEDNLVTNIVRDENDKRLMQGWEASQESRFNKVQYLDDGLSQNKPKSQEKQISGPLSATNSTSNRKARLLPADESSRHKHEAVKPVKERSSVIHSEDPKGFQEAQLNKETTSESESGLNQSNNQSNKGSFWMQKSTWKELVAGESGDNSFSISSILPGIASMQQKLTIPKDSEVVKSNHRKSQNSIKKANIHSTGESFKALGVVENQGTMGEEVSAGATLVDTLENKQKIRAGLEREQSILEKISANVEGDAFSRGNAPVKEDHQESKTAIPAVGSGVSCTFMRSAASEREWMKARSALLKKRGNNVTIDKSKGFKGTSNR